MKSFNLFAPALLCGLALAAETPVTPEITPQREWKKSAENTFTIQRTAAMQGTASLIVKAPLKPETFYVIDWEARGNLPGSDGQGQFILDLDNKVFPVFEVGKEWNRYRNWFYSGKKSSGNVTFYLRGGKEQSLELRNIALTELSPEDCGKGFLFDFEKDNTLPGLWSRSWGQKKFAASVVKSDFINGETSMKLVSDGAPASISSVSIPMTGGAKYKVSFWAKGSANGSLLFIFNSNNQRLSGNQPPINLLRKDCAIETQWKEYSFEVTFPTDLKKYPNAVIPMANLVISSKIPEVLLDNFKVEPVK